MTDAVAYYPPETRVLTLTLLRRERMLPARGEVLVTQGQRVEPSDVVARTEFGGQYRILDIARLLRVPASKTAKLLKRSVGDTVEVGDVIARRSGLGARRVRASVAGRITHFDEQEGRMAIEVSGEPLELSAYLKGTVGNVFENRGVVVETAGAMIQAAWGIGGESYGVLRVVSESPDGPLKTSVIDHKAHGRVVVSGGWLTEAALEQAQQLQLRGIIAGSIEGDLIETAMQMPFPIILTEGIGRIAMSEPIFELLQAQEGREASFNATVRTRWGATRPEILIPLPSDTRPSMPEAVGAPLTMGARVRIVRGEHLGWVGVVADIPSRAQRLDTGMRVHGAMVRFDRDSTVFVPFANLEVMR